MLRTKLSFQRMLRRIVAGAAILIALALAPQPSSAENLLDFLFGGGQKHQSQQPSLFGKIFNNDPQPGQPAQVNAGSGPAFCVRSCDGKYFPLMRGAASPTQMCQAFCPASPTKIFFGSNIDNAYASTGERYADSANAFAYRKALRADCTCNGRSPVGLATIDLALDGSLRSGDVVASGDGPVAQSSLPARNDRNRISHR